MILGFGEFVGFGISWSSLWNYYIGTCIHTIYPDSHPRTPTIRFSIIGEEFGAVPDDTCIKVP